MELHLDRSARLHLAPGPKLGPVRAQVDGVAAETAAARLDPRGPRDTGSRVGSTAALSGFHAPGMEQGPGQPERGAGTAIVLAFPPGAAQDGDHAAHYGQRKGSLTVRRRGRSIQGPRRYCHLKESAR